MRSSISQNCISRKNGSISAGLRSWSWRPWNRNLWLLSRRFACLTEVTRVESENGSAAVYVFVVVFYPFVLVLCSSSLWSLGRQYGSVKKCQLVLQMNHHRALFQFIHSVEVLEYPPVHCIDPSPPPSECPLLWSSSLYSMSRRIASSSLLSIPPHHLSSTLLSPNGILTKILWPAVVNLKFQLVLCPLVRLAINNNSLYSADWLLWSIYFISLSPFPERLIHSLCCFWCANGMEHFLLRFLTDRRCRGFWTHDFHAGSLSDHDRIELKSPTQRADHHEMTLIYNQFCIHWSLFCFMLDVRIIWTIRKWGCPCGKQRGDEGY